MIKSPDRTFQLTVFALRARPAADRRCWASQTRHPLLLGSFLAAMAPSAVLAEDEVSLFNGFGKAEAYLARDDEMAIYLWNGKPAAYLESDGEGGNHVYGFNGKHLGWFVRGVIWDHEGNGSCAVKEVLQATQAEPFKAFKQFKPFKSFTQFAPFRPTFSNKFGATQCGFLLMEGSK